MIPSRVIISLIIIPSCISIVLSVFNYYNLINTEITKAVAVGVALIPILIPFFAFAFKYIDPYFFRMADDEITVNEFQSLITIVYIEIFVIISVIIIFNILPADLKNIQILKDPYYPTYVPLAALPFIATIYATISAVGRTYFTKDFGYHFARKCMIVLKGKKWEVEKIQYLMIALKWYNKFIKRNLKLEFDIAKICSRILSANDKKQVIDRLVASFEIDDKLKRFEIRVKTIEDELKPINCLSIIANLASSQSLLIQKKLSTEIKDLALLLAAIIPAVITLLQFILPILRS
jgi:hypothetical protein